MSKSILTPEKVNEIVVEFVKSRNKLFVAEVFRVSPCVVEHALWKKGGEFRQYVSQSNAERFASGREILKERERDLPIIELDNAIKQWTLILERAKKVGEFEEETWKLKNITAAQKVEIFQLEKEISELRKITNNFKLAQVRGKNVYVD